MRVNSTQVHSNCMVLVLTCSLHRLSSLSLSLLHCLQVPHSLSKLSHLSLESLDLFFQLDNSYFHSKVGVIEERLLQPLKELSSHPVVGEIKSNAFQISQRVALASVATS